MGSRMSGGMHVGIAEEGQREIVSQEEHHLFAIEVWTDKEQTHWTRMSTNSICLFFFFSELIICYFQGSVFSF